MAKAKTESKPAEQTAAPAQTQAQAPAQTAEEKALAEQKAAAAKAEKEKAAKEKAEAKAKVKKDKEDAKAKAKADKLAAKEASKMPEQNGVRRPKPLTLCGQAWTIFDEVSTKNGEPATIGESMEIAKAKGFNEANVRAEYARWRKFHGISGRVAKPKPAAAPVAAPAEGASA